MSRIRGSNTEPELAVRRRLRAERFRFRLHARDLPGTPDIVLPRYRTVVFVHGCFWHRHPGCAFATKPTTREAFWQDKFAANVKRDQRQQRELREASWRVEVVWECELSRCPALDRLVGLSNQLRTRARYAADRHSSNRDRSDTSVPPNFDRHLKNVTIISQRVLQSSKLGVRASAAVATAMM